MTDCNQKRWTIIGPGGGGATFLPTINPHDNNNVITVCDMTGAYVTYDAGESWREFNLKTRVDAVAFDPVDGNTIYAGSSGLFRSVDKGISWRLVFPDPAKVTGEALAGDEAGHRYLSGDNWPGGKIHGIAVDPADTNCLHICIDKRFDSGGLALCRSADRGATWVCAGNLEGKRLHKLYLDPSSLPGDRRVYAFTDTAVQCVCSNGNKLDRIALPAGAETIIQAGCGIDPASGKPVFFLLTPASWEGRKFRSGIYRSSDLGATWTLLDGGLDDDLHGPDNGQSRLFRNIGVTEQDCRTVWLDVWREPFEFFDHPQPEMNYLGILHSADMGETWQWSMKAGATFPDNLTGGWQERNYSTDWYGGPLGMSASPNNPGICWFTGYMGNYRTLDGGKTWRQNYSHEYPDFSSSTRGIDVTTCYGVHFDPHDDSHMAISYTDIGLQHSHDGGESWKQTMIGVPRHWINTCYWLTFDPDVKGRVWSAWAYTHDLPRYKLFHSRMYENNPGGVCLSDDGMETWRQSSAGLPEGCSPTHIVLDPLSPAESRTLYIACMGKGVFKSVDGGHTWSQKINGFADNLNAWRLALLPDGTLYVIVYSTYRDGLTIEGRLYKSADGAESWVDVALPDGCIAPNDLVFDPSNPARMYLACWPQSGEKFGVGGGLFRSEDGGAGWKRIFDGTPFIYGLGIHPQNPSTVFIATFTGSVYRSDEYGENWRRIRGYNFKWGHRPIVDIHDSDMIYVTTFGSSVWHGPAEGDGNALEDIIQ